MSWIVAIENSLPYWLLVSFFGLYPVVTSIFWIIGGMFYHFRRDKRIPPKAEYTGDFPFVSILIPAYCEEETIALALEGALCLDYPDFEVIAINDGSVDGTVQRVLPFLADPRVRLLDKHINEGKAMALNDALICAKGDLVLVMDADSIPDRMLLRRMVPHFAWPNVGAVAGNPRVRNRRSLLAKLQAVEFTSVIGLLRRAQRIWGRVMCVS
ncbi:MAG: glycosyltransferase, partial [Acidobacteriia bacterium]|nr:glycosyltransferase [Terriglobia bacterium]